MRAGVMSRFCLVAMALFLAALAPSCGGGGDDDVTGGVVASFTPATATPTALQMTMQPGSVSGTTFKIRITATDVTDFFGAAFTVGIPDEVVFVALDSSQSFLRDGGFGDALLRFDVNASTPNKIIVAATRLNAGANPGVNVSGTRDLLTLTLRVNQVFSAEPVVFTDSLEVRNSVQPPPEGELIPVTWSGGAVAASQ